ncbi:cytochrome P450 [Astrocystis sublimbata]|nr:cytochrome P450 [Astrocystis sublimbata]
MSNSHLWALASLAALLYFVGLVIYRLYFHPLAKFPGPRLAAATGWYETVHDLKGPGGQFMYKLRELHEQYGPIVRLSPHEVHISDTTWADKLFVGNAKGTRDKYLPAAAQAGTPMGVFGTSTHSIHRRRRAALNPLFSKSCATSVEGLVYDRVDVLMKLMDTQIKRDGHADLRTVFVSFAADVVLEYCLGHSFGFLQDETSGKEWHNSVRALAKTICYTRQFNWMIAVSQMLPLPLVRAVSPSMARVVGMHIDMEAQASQAVKEYEKNEKNRTDLPFHRPNQRFAVFRALLQHGGLPAQEKKYNRISHEAVTLMAAGSETLSSNLATAVFFILADKERILTKLREELRSVTADGDSRPSFAQLEKLPWLTGIVKETLRIATVTARMTRVAPDEALQYEDWVMPPGTAVSMTYREISFDPEIFPEPMEFRPERWLPSNPTVEKCNQHLVAFGRGSRMCIGLNLAYVELYVVLASLFLNKDFELYNTIRERDVDFTRDFFVGDISPEGKGVQVKYAE